MAQILFLRKLRDFGEKISDSLLFLKTNWKNLFLLYGIFVVPFIIAATVIGLFFAGHLYNNMLGNAESLNTSDIFNGEFVVIILCLLMSGASYQAAVYSYMRLYEEKKGQQPTIAEVGQVFAPKFIKLFFYNIAVSCIIGICIAVPMIIFTVAPAITLFTMFLFFIVFIMVFLHINCIYVMEDGGFSQGIIRLFDLLRSRWWHSIGFTILIGLIYYVFGFMVQIILSLFGVISINFLTPNTMEGAGSKAAISGMVLGVGFLVLLQQLFYLIVFCGIGINYFSLVEEKDGSAIEEQIDAIGSNNDKYGGVEEQY